MLKSNVLNLVGEYGCAIIDSDDGLLQNFMLSIDSYEDYDDEIHIFDLEDRQFIIKLCEGTVVEGNVIKTLGYQIRVV